VRLNERKVCKLYKLETKTQKTMSVNSLYHKTNERLEEELGWIRKAQKDPSSFGPLYKAYHEQIFRYIYQRMNDEDLAFDITSQVFMKAMGNIQKYEYRGVPFASWLYRIAKSELYQSFRDKKAERTVNVESFQIFEVAEEMEEDSSELNKKRIFQCLSEMKENDMQLIEMRFFEKRSFREIGEILELTENNAKVKTFRALEKLKQLFINKQN
jgi:RNA polymerase sigma-70 factor, ECF subfamily